MSEIIMPKRSDEFIKKIKINGDPNREIAFDFRSTRTYEKFRDLTNYLQNSDISGEIEAVEDGEDKPEKQLLILDRYNLTIKEKLDEIFGEGASEKIFDGDQPFTLVDDKPLIQYFFESIDPVIRDQITHYRTVLNNLGKHVDKYKIR